MKISDYSNPWGGIPLLMTLQMSLMTASLYLLELLFISISYVSSLSFALDSSVFFSVFLTVSAALCVSDS